MQKLCIKEGVDLALEGVRGIAILLVVLYHLHVDAFSWGYVGVDIFFVLSGYLITKIIAKDVATHHFRFADFYLRRLRRLMPALLLVLLVVAGVSAIWQSPYMQWRSAWHLLATIFGVENILLWYQENAYFQPLSKSMPLLHGWSLSVEMQFYMLYPLLLVWLLKRKNHMQMMAILGGLCLLSFAGYVWGLFSQNVSFASAVFYFLPTRAWELLLGGLLALGMPLPSAVLRVWRLCVPCLSTHGLVMVGQISYALYLWHWPLLVWSRSIPLHGLSAGIYKMIALMVALLFSVLTWRWVERPTRMMGLGDRRFIGGLGCGLALLLACVLWLVLGNGGFSKNSAWGKLLLQTSQELHPMHAACNRNAQDKTPPPWQGCVVDAHGNVSTKTTSQPYELLVWGDSNADHLMPALRTIALEKKMSMREIAQNQCAPLLADDVEDHEPCNQLNKAVWQEILQHPEIKWVVLGGMWREYTESGDYYDFVVEGRHVPLAEALRHTVQKLKARGVQVLVLGQIPTFLTLEGFDTCVEYLSRRQDDRYCLEKHNIFNFIPTRDMLNSLAQGGVVIWQPTDTLCDTQKCKIYDDKGMFYRDGGHLSTHGARFLLSALRQVWLPHIK